MQTSTRVPPAIGRWHDMLAAGDFSRLEGLLAEEVVFHSPVVHTPQAGRAITARYLRAAFAVLNGPAFRYSGQWFAERSGVLEFETVIGGIKVDGVDIIEWREDERIVTFKVMVRPLKAIQAVHEAMAAELQRGAAPR